MDKKALVEMRNAKIEEMNNIVNAAKKEERVINEDENKKFNDIKAEIEDIDNMIAAMDEVNNLGIKPIPKAGETMTKEEKDRKTFENYLRGIKNTDEPTTKTGAQVIIPTTVWDTVIDKVIQICPIYERAERFNIKGKLVLPKYDRENSSIVMEYADEGTAAESGKAVFAQIELNGFVSRVLAKISVSLINNTDFDIVGFVEGKMAEAIALFVEKELLKGTDSKIEGLRGITADMTVTTAAPTAITADELMSTQDAVIDNYQGNSIWIMNRKTRDAIRKLKDNEGDYLLNRDFTAKWGYSLLGKDVYCSDAMDTIAAGKTAIFYGDFSGLAVKISEEANMQVLRERYAEEHQIGILAFMEMDAKVQDTQKIAKLVCKAG